MFFVCNHNNTHSPPFILVPVNICFPFFKERARTLSVVGAPALRTRCLPSQRGQWMRRHNLQRKGTLTSTKGTLTSTKGTLTSIRAGVRASARAIHAVVVVVCLAAAAAKAARTRVRTIVSTRCGARATAFFRGGAHTLHIAHKSVHCE